MNQADHVLNGGHGGYSIGAFSGSGDGGNERLSLAHSSSHQLPEGGKVAGVEQLPHLENVADVGGLNAAVIEKVLRQGKVRTGQRHQRQQQNPANRLLVEPGKKMFQGEYYRKFENNLLVGIQLVELEGDEHRLLIVLVLRHHRLHVRLQTRKILRIVAEGKNRSNAGKLLMDTDGTE